MSVSFPVSFPVSFAGLWQGSWQAPDGVVIVGFGLVFGLLHVVLVATIIQLLRRRRFPLLLVALAVYGWALGLWSSAGAGAAPMRAALGGSQPFDDLNLVAQLIFVSLALVVIVAAWRRVRKARAGIQLQAPARAAAPFTPPVASPLAPPMPPVDADDWLR
jgi:hypothetical protein